MAKKTKNLLNRKFRAKPKPVIPQGSYTKPRYWAIKLDPEQAVLSSCMVGGAGYMYGDNCARGGGFGYFCSTSVKHAPLVGGSSADVQVAPS